MNALVSNLREPSLYTSLYTSLLFDVVLFESCQSVQRAVGLKRCALDCEKDRERCRRR